jgi:hypothetical protein
MKYMAADGSVFNTAKECEKYEESLAERLIGDIPHYIVNASDWLDGSDSNLYIFMRIENEDQLTRFKKWVGTLYGAKGVMNDVNFDVLIGNDIIVDCSNYTDEGLNYIDSVYSIKTVQEYISRLVKEVYDYANKIEKENTK